MLNPHLLNNLVLRSMRFVCFGALLWGCQPEEIVFADNDIPAYDGISTLTVQNYVNRLFIDCIGREPTDIEMDTTVVALETAALHHDARKAIVESLMAAPATSVGFHDKVYSDLKARFLQGASDEDLMSRYSNLVFNALNDSLGGNLVGYAAAMEAAGRILDVVDARDDYAEGGLAMNAFCKRLCWNNLYDEINMNSFNFVNATFDDLFGRFPTTAEFDLGYDIIEYNQAHVFFGMAAQDKPTYLEAMVSDEEWAEGMVRWAAAGMWAREPSHGELLMGLEAFLSAPGGNYEALLQEFLTTDDYAGFD